MIALDPLLAFTHVVARRSAQELVELPYGFAVFHGDYPSSYEHNRVVATGPVEQSRAVDDTDRLFGERGLRHRRIDGAHPASAGWTMAGYERTVNLFMVLTATPVPSALAGEVEHVPYAVIAPAVADAWRRDLPGVDEAVVRQLVERHRLTAAACHVTHHVIRRDGVPVARADLLRDGDMAEVDGVMTEPAWRNQGLARAVVLDAVRTALGAGCRTVFLIADGDDWPQALYRKLGFADAGVTVGFTLRS